MIEILLLESQAGAYVTNFFNGTYHLIWQGDTLTSLPLQGGQIAVARLAAFAVLSLTSPLDLLRLSHLLQTTNLFGATAKWLIAGLYNV